MDSIIVLCSKHILILQSNQLSICLHFLYIFIKFTNFLMFLQLVISDQFVDHTQICFTIFVHLDFYCDLAYELGIIFLFCHCFWVLGQFSNACYQSLIWCKWTLPLWGVSAYWWGSVKYPLKNTRVRGLVLWKWLWNPSQTWWLRDARKHCLHHMQWTAWCWVRVLQASMHMLLLFLFA